MSTKPHFLGDLEEGIGTLEAVKEQDGFTQAMFKGFSLLLPRELAPQLTELVGLRVGVLRIDGSFKVRVEHGNKEIA